MSAYYNEFNPECAAWLRELIKRNLIAPGDVDERSINDVDPEEIKNYTQHHFFAGIGGWSLALRMAGWSDNKPVLTGSPPCQPFSCAGKQKGIKDERHLAPKWLEMVTSIRSPFVFGEQVATAITKDNWLDDLLDALEENGYTTGAIVLPACGIGSPHIRQRLWFTGRISNTAFYDDRRNGQSGTKKSERSETGVGTSCCGETSNQLTPKTGWDNPDWLFCQDGKWRPVESGTFPLVARVPRGMVPDGNPCDEEYVKTTGEARGMRLRGYGNSIVPQVAVEVIKCVIENP